MDNITWTRFSSAAAMQANVLDGPWAMLVSALYNADTYPDKKSCPWLKLATFGNLRTSKNSLRHDANVLTITGVEGDYDGEAVSVDAAIEMLERYQIRACVYTSPSHTPERPRWRVLAPLSSEHAPQQRAALLARLNGALGGILTRESFTLSQSYYWGRVDGVEYRVEVTYNDPDDGQYLDTLDDLDEIAISKIGKRHANDSAEDCAIRPSYGLDMFDAEVRRLGRKLKTGDGRRELLKSYIASRSARGLVRDELLSIVAGVSAAYFDASDPIDAENVKEICDFFAKKDVASQPILTRSAPVAKAKRKRYDYPAPYPGVMAEIVEKANESAHKPQPLLNMLAAIIGMAGCINGEYSTKSGGRFNLYGIGALQSGGGKDHPRIIAEMIAKAGDATILGRPASGAGLEDSIAARKNQLVSIDEIAHILQSINDVKAASHMTDIGATLLKFYSASRSAYNKRILAKMQGKSPHTESTIPNPCVSVLGFATTDGLANAFTDKNFTDGLMARMLFVAGDNDVAARRPCVGFEIPSSVDEVVAQMAQIDALAFAAGVQSHGSVVIDESAVSDELDNLISTIELSRDRTLAVAPSLYARSYEKIERIACVLAIWDNPAAPKLSSDHIKWARDLVLASDDAMLDFVRGEMFSCDTTKAASKLRRLIVKILAGGISFQDNRPIEREAFEAGCVARSQLLRASKLDKKTLDAVLAYMQDLGELMAFDATGKPLAVLQSIAVSNDD